MTISNEVLEAHAYLMYVMGQSIEKLAAFVRDVGPVDGAAAIRNGSAPEAVLAEIARQDAPTDLLADAGGARLIAPGSDEWPTDAFAPLRAAGTEPFGLWVRGDVSLAELTRGAIAIVGTRAATGYGSHIAADFAYSLACRGVTVIARAAYGIDESAVRGALSGEGKPLAVLTHGIDVTYPAGLGRQFKAIVDQGGLLVSEYPLHTAPARHRQLACQRIVAALAAATVVVEAGIRSDTLGIGTCR